MFFNLSRDSLENFPYHHILPNGLVLNTDDGWEVYTVDNHTVIVKGYINQSSLSEIINDLITHDVPVYKGNFCAIVADSEYVKILHDTNRGFPLWVSDVCITNLVNPDGSINGDQHWVDRVITTNSKLEYSQSFFNPYYKSTQNLTDNELIDTIHNTICETYEQFLSHNTKPLKLFLSGGIDTTTAWAYLDHFTKNYELVDYEYIKFTPFWKKNKDALKNYWGYKQIHLWDNDCVLVTGSNGDENFLRGPLTLAMALKTHGIIFNDILKPTDYHYQYLNKKTKKVYKTIEEVYDTIEDVQDYILNLNVNDHQHWHLGKTITFTPFKNINLLEIILNSSKDLIVAQARNGFINRELIAKMDSCKLTKLSNQKNTIALENL